MSLFIFAFTSSLRLFITYFPSLFAIFQILICIFILIIGPIFALLPATSPDRAQLRNKPISGRFDSDSFLIGVDNHASACMVNDRSRIIGPLTPLPDRKVKGAKGLLSVAGKGPGLFPIEDDDGNVHNIIIQNTLLVPELPFCLLCPQHWSQDADDNYPNHHGTWCATFDDECILYWDQQRYKRTLRWDRRTNTARFRSAPSATTYRVFAAAFEQETQLEEREHVCYHVAYNTPHVIPPDDEID